MEAEGTRSADLEARKGQDKGSEKTPGHATTSGQDYEVALCCLVFLRALRHASDFFLLSNFAPAGNLDDVVLFYRLRGDPKYSTVLVQAKYREMPRRKKLTRSYPFSLAKYSASFAGFRALCAGGVPLEGDLLKVREVSAFLYSSDGCCDFDGVACDANKEQDVELPRDFLDTGGRFLRVTDATRLGLPEDFASSLTLCTEQTSLDGVDGHLERELRALLALTASADVAELRTRLREGVKRWWSARGEGRSLTARSPEWTDVLRLQVARLNGPLLNLYFSEESLAVVRCVLENELAWITVADERQARATRGRLLHAALGGSCLVLDAAAGLLAWDQVEALWGTAACPTLVLDLTSAAASPPAWSQLLGAVSGHRRLAVIVLQETPPPEAQWFPFQAEPTWSVLNGKTRKRLLEAEVSLQGSVVALRDVLGGDAPPRLSDEVISALCGPAAAVLRLGVASDSSCPENYVHQCLQRTVPGYIDWGDLRQTKALVFLYDKLPKDTFTILNFGDLERMNDITEATVVRRLPSHSEIRKECCRLSVRGYTELFENEVNQFVPCPWLCKDRVVIVEGVAGVGKSTFVTTMCSKVKELFPAYWVLRYDLAKHSDFIRRGDFSDIPGFLLRVLPVERPSLLRELLEHSLYAAGNVFLFMDAFDEISPDYNTQCCQLLQEIASTVKFEQMVVTTRSVNTKDVEKALGVKAFRLPVFSRGELDLFLERFCKSKDIPVDESRITSLREAVGPMLEVPLLCRMAAEVLLQSDDQDVLRYKNPWSKVLLYERFVEQMTVNRQAEKVDLPPTLHGKRLLESQAKEHLRNLQAMAVRTLFPEVQFSNFVLSSELPDEKLGLVVSNGSSVDFEHRTFAEFFLGRWLALHWELCPRELLRQLLNRESSEFVAATLSWSLFEDSQPHLAVARGEEVRSETTDRGGRTVLHVAAMTTGGQLLEFSGEVVHREDDVLGATAARCAEMYGNWEFLETLISKGTTLRGLRFLTDGDTPEEILNVALRRDLPGILKVILLRHRRLRDHRLGYIHDSLLHVAAASGSVNVIRYLLVEQQCDVDIENNYGDTPLQSSVRGGHVEALTLLLDKGAELNKQSSNDDTAMMKAASGGDEQVLKVLLEKGGYANIQGEPGFTVMMGAALRGDVEVVKVLLEKGADANIQERCGNTAMMIAAYMGHVDVVKVLLEKGGDANVRDKRGNTVMTLAAHRGDTKVVKVLLEKGGDANVQDKRGYTALMLAAESGHVEVLKVLLEKGGDANVQDKHGYTALMLAAKSGHVEVLKVLLEKGGDANVQDTYGKTAMMLAAYGGHVEVLSMLLENGGDANIQDEDGNTAIMLAARKGNMEVVKAMLEKRSGINIQDEGGNTAIMEMMEAAYEGLVEVVKEFLEKAADTNVRDEHVSTALMLAAYGGHVEVLKVLLEKGGNANIQDTYGNAALMLAAERGHVEVVKVLFEKGGDTNIQDTYGNTAMMLAAYGGHVEVLTMLLENGGDANIQDEEGNTAIMLAACEGHVEVLKVLLEKGGDANVQDKYGNTALMEAAVKGHVEVLKVLLEKGGDANVQNKYGNTALMEAAVIGHVEVLKVLLEKGADANIQETNGYTALMLAAERSHVDVLKVLLEKGADANVQDKRGYTALMLAAERGHVDVLKVMKVFYGINVATLR